MQLLPKSLAKNIPALYSDEQTPVCEKVAHAKFFDPSGRLTFYVLEFDGVDALFGWMVSPLGADCDELGGASLAELQAIRGRFGLGLERDTSFQPTKLGDIRGLDLGTFAREPADPAVAAFDAAVSR